MHEAVSDILDLIERARATGSSRMVVVSLVRPRAAARGDRADAGRLAAVGQPKAKVTPMMISLGGAVGAERRRDDADCPGGPCRRWRRRRRSRGRDAAGGQGAGDGRCRIRSSKPKPKTPPKTVEKPVDKSREPEADDRAGSQDRRRARRHRCARRFRSAACPTGGGGTGGVQINVGDFCCPEYIAAMNAADQARTGTGTRAPPGGRSDEVHHPAGRHDHRRRGRADRAATRCSTSSRSARSVKTATAAAAAARVHRGRR